MDMTRAWRMLDNEIERTPMPAEYNDFNVVVGFSLILFKLARINKLLVNFQNV